MLKTFPNTNTPTRRCENVGCETKSWQIALCGSIDTAEHKLVVLSLLFLKWISDAFGEFHAKLEGFPVDPDGVPGAVH